MIHQATMGFRLRWAIWVNVFLWTAGAQGSEILNHTGLKAGIVVFPKCETVEPILAAGKTPGWLTLAVAEGDRAGQLKTAALDNGTLGQSLYVASHTLLTDRLASAIIVTDATTADLTETNLVEWKRLLAPRRGILLIGSARPATGLRAALEKWSHGLDAVRFVEKGGLWLAARRPPDVGADEWTHKWHDPANGMFSRDATFQPPFLPQWYDWPIFGGKWNSCLIIGGGYEFFLMPDHNSPRDPAVLECRDHASGVRLWEKSFSWDPPRGVNGNGIQPGRSGMLYCDGALWLAMDHEIVKMDPETGSELSRFQGCKAGTQIKWMAMENGRLYLMSGPMDEYKLGLQLATTNPFGRHLAALNPRNGALLWSNEEAGDVDERLIAVRAGRLYCYAAGSRVACRDGATGKLIWENKDPEVIQSLTWKLGRELNQFLNSVRCFTVGPDAIIFAASGFPNMVAIDTKSGQCLWSRKQSTSRGRVAHFLLKDGVLHTQDGQLDPLTGKPVKKARLPTSGCGITTMAGKYFITCFGLVFDDEKRLRNLDVKPDCNTGVVIADGLGASPAGTCRCALEVRGYRVFGSAPGRDPFGPGDRDGRFAKGPAFGVAAGKPATSADWTAFGGDYRHANASSATVASQQPAPVWSFAAEFKNSTTEEVFDFWRNSGVIKDPEFYPTQAIVVGGRVYFGDSHGVVRAFDGANGRELWRNAIGFRILGAPVYGLGRLFVASADGRVYALRAEDGALAWDFRAAPYDRLIRKNGELVSTWPVGGGPVFKDGILYAVAGYQSGQGVHAYALNAVTGAVIWESHDGGTGGRYGLDAAPGNLGLNTIAGGRLWCSSFTGIPFSFDIKDGSWIAQPPGALNASINRYGGQMAALGEDWVVYGGRRWAEPYESWSMGVEKQRGYSVCRTGLGKLPEPVRGKKDDQAQVGAFLVEDAIVPPAFDQTQVLLGNNFSGPKKKMEGTLALYDRGEFEDAMTRPQPPPKTYTASSYYFTSLTGRSSRQQDVSLPMGALWERTINPMQAVLAANVVLVLHQLPLVDKKTPGKWHLSALDRNDGHDLWTIELPCRPAWNGLSVGADGTVIVALWDGSLFTWK